MNSILCIVLIGWLVGYGWSSLVSSLPQIPPELEFLSHFCTAAPPNQLVPNLQVVSKETSSSRQYVPLLLRPWLTRPSKGVYQFEQILTGPLLGLALHHLWEAARRHWEDVAKVIAVANT